MEMLRSQIVEALYRAGLEEDALYEKYSGRGMYGRECFGIVGSTGQFASFVAALAELEIGFAARLGDVELVEWIGDVVSDSMGMSTIWYWPSVTLVAGEER